MPMKKDRRVAVTRSKRRNRAAEMVAPDREMPGRMGERAWKAPMMRASLTPTSLMPLPAEAWAAPAGPSERWSATHMTALQMMSAPAMIHRERAVTSMKSLRASPTTATGIEPRMMPQPSV